ncbi:hypothetical protein K437DRAFT_271738 [Tilletiaria anomala UBC 951]|uniref:Uncharacterized protein n=1 Tax=Tilletiaria anomala (strain ATCC 24038 / CBS 436.72 / UBC 951) TaxID=1037660 RepID=A0A066WQD3_TILAU|nr:uncharacterized protein K437DRAFT_271738 [Tilletiaria anomala UBC 951]KDN53219.1 hypothetical protein K437DRAFT_271738 [Tilletiaria anomala UBC 951]
MAHVPYISVQPTYPAAFADVSQSILPQETAWVSIYAQNAPNASVHGKLLLEPCVAKTRGSAEEQRNTAGGVALTVKDGEFAIERVTGSYADFTVRTPKGNDGSMTNLQDRSARKRSNQIHAGPTKVRFSRRHIQTCIKTRAGISALDISPISNNLYVVGGDDGALYVGRTNQGDRCSENVLPQDDSTRAITTGEPLDEGERIEKLAQAKMAARQAQTERERVLPLTGHVGDVRSARFFPSGEVILTTSSDLTARIFSALEDSNPRTFKGHKRAILCSEIIDRGREVLTAGADGTVRLWDVGANKQIGLFASERFSSINALVLQRHSADATGGNSQGKLLATALSSGRIELHDLGARRSAALIPALKAFPPGSPPAASDIWDQSAPGPLFSLDWDSERHIIAAGSREGVIALHDDRMLSSSLSSGSGNAREGEATQTDDAPSTDGRSTPRSLLGCWRRNGAAINDLRLVSSNTAASSLDIVVATSDGLPYRASLRPILTGQRDENFSVAPEVVEEYAEWDCDSVEKARLDPQGRVWLAGTDGLLRRY